MNTPKVHTDNNPDAEIAHRIKNALIVKGINQEDLAREAGLSYSTLRRSLDQKRDDRRSLTVQQIGKIADALEVHPSVLMPATFAGDVA